MPEISRFFGIVVRMFFNDHEPPHFHVSYGEFEALIEVGTLAIYRGELPRRALALTLDGLRSIALNCTRIGAWQRQDISQSRLLRWNKGW